MPAPEQTPAPRAGTRRIRDYFRPYRAAFGAGIIFLILTQATALAVPRLLRLATDALVARDLSSVAQFAMILLVVAVLGGIVRIFSRILIFNSGRRVEFDVRNDLFFQLSRFPPSYYGTMSTGQIMSRAINDLTQVRLLLGPGILNLSNTTLVYLVVVPLLFYSDPVLAALCLLSLPALILAGRAFGRRIFKYSRESQDQLGILSNKVQENLGGVMTVRAYARESAEQADFDDLNQNYFETNLRLAQLRSFMFPLMGLFGAFSLVVLLLLGGRRIIAGQMSLGQFVEFNAYLATLTWPTIALGWMISLWQRGLASMARINEIFESEPSIVDGILVPAPLRGRIEFRDLSFHYSENAAPALRDLSVVIKSGETIVIVGKTGSGKSTFLKSIPRLIEIEEGALFLDAVDVTQLPLGHVREACAYAPQEAFLFSRSIFENIAFGQPDASEEAVRAAAKKAGLEPDLAGFKEGLDTIVGERGVTLSGGQRQRVALARALLLDAQILLLDDTLAAVDTDTEQKILAELAKAQKERTTIIVTHRLACAELADRILVMEDGRIAEQGTEAELLALEGIYREMHKRQRLREAVETSEGSDEEIMTGTHGFLGGAR